jgi:hypothetical protein
MLANAKAEPPRPAALMVWWPLAAAVLVGAVAWGDLKASVSGQAIRLDRLERRDEAAAVNDAAVLQRLTSVEVELRALRALLERQFNERGLR